MGDKIKKPREIGLTFGEELVRKILDGKKMQTRRPLPRAPWALPGDLLYVRETWAPVDELAYGYALEDPSCVGYRATLTARVFGAMSSSTLNVKHWAWDRVKWRPSIHMPRWAARAFLSVAEVREERVTEISEQDAIDEGVWFDGTHWRGLPGNGNGYASARDAFLSLWDAIYSDPKIHGGGPLDTRQEPRVRVYRWSEVHTKAPKLGEARAA